MKPTLLIGAPGTGKTHRLVEEIIELKPDKFALVSFTRRAAHEAKDRLRAYYSEKELKYVRTIHSLCFELLGLRTTQVMTFQDLRKFGNEWGYDFHGRYRALEEDSFDMLTEDDAEYKEMMISIAKCAVTNTVLYNRYMAFKKDRKLIDYNDMISMACNLMAIDSLSVYGSHIELKLDLLCVDEIQDLTPLQMSFVHLLSTYSKNVIYAGDDNQMIFEWAGVDREKFFDLANNCTQEILKKNYRFKGNIPKLAHKITCRQASPTIAALFGMGYSMQTEHENIENIEYIATESMDFKKGESYLILARNGYLLSRTAAALDYLGEAWDWLGEESKPGSIKLSTIHGAKGAEADNVILMTDVSPATYENIENDSEHRVWYVAVTRAKKKLYIVQPQTDMYYDLF